MRRRVPKPKYGHRFVQRVSTPWPAIWRWIGCTMNTDTGKRYFIYGIVLQNWSAKWLERRFRVEPLNLATRFEPLFALVIAMVDELSNTLKAEQDAPRAPATASPLLGNAARVKNMVQQSKTNGREMVPRLTPALHWAPSG